MGWNYLFDRKRWSDSLDEEVGGESLWTPGALSGLISAPTFSLMRSAGKLWQDEAQTVPATAHGHRVYKAQCTFSDRLYAAQSDITRPTLCDEGDGKWSLNVAVGQGLFQTGPASLRAVWAAVRIGGFSDGIVGFGSIDLLVDRRFGPVWFPNSETLFTGNGEDWFSTVTYTNRVNGVATSVWPGADVWGVAGQVAASAKAVGDTDQRSYGTLTFANPPAVGLRLAGWVEVSDLADGETELIESYLAGRMP